MFFKFSSLQSTIEISGGRSSRQSETTRTFIRPEMLVDMVAEMSFSGLGWMMGNQQESLGMKETRSLKWLVPLRPQPVGHWSDLWMRKEYWGIIPTGSAKLARACGLYSWSPQSGPGRAVARPRVKTNNVKNGYPGWTQDARAKFLKKLLQIALG